MSFLSMVTIKKPKILHHHVLQANYFTIIIQGGRCHVGHTFKMYYSAQNCWDLKPGMGYCVALYIIGHTTNILKVNY